VINHTGVVASEFAKSKQFYAAALQPIGYELLMEFPAAGLERCTAFTGR
jgi:hypothetical protein